MRRWNALLCTLIPVLGACCGLSSAQAQSFPDRSITLVIPFAPGGSTSIVGRVIADKMSRLLGQGIIVDNRAGAGGTFGTKLVAKSDPDGYTILLGYTGTLAIGPSLYKNVGYDPRKDFAPIGMIGNAPNSLVVHPSFPVATIAELIDFAKEHPGKVNFGSAGAGTVSHITGEYFARAAGIKLQHIPYKGTGPALTDLLGGHIPMAFADSGRPCQRLGWIVARARRDELDPQQPAAGGTDDVRSRCAWFRCFALLRAGGAGRHAASCDRQAQQGIARRIGLRRGEEAARARRHRDHAGDAGGLCRFPR